MAELKVVLFKMPESNGKRNWQAYFKRKNDPDFEGLIGSMGGICISWGECWNRVAYEAERARFLLGERTTEPCIMAYGEDVATPEEWFGNDPEAANWGTMSTNNDLSKEENKQIKPYSEEVDEHIRKMRIKLEKEEWIKNNPDER